MRQGRNATLSGKVHLEIHSFVVALAKSQNLTVSRIVEKLIVKGVIPLVKQNSVKKRLQEYQRRQDLDDERRKNKELNRARYHITNTMRTCLNLARSSAYLNHGDINLKPIHSVIKGAKKEFKLLPLAIRKELKKDWDELQKLKTHDGVVKMLGFNRRLDVK